MEYRLSVCSFWTWGGPCIQGGVLARDRWGKRKPHGDRTESKRSGALKAEESEATPRPLWLASRAKESRLLRALCPIPSNVCLGAWSNRRWDQQKGWGAQAFRGVEGQTDVCVCDI